MCSRVELAPACRPAAPSRLGTGRGSCCAGLVGRRIPRPCPCSQPPLPSCRAGRALLLRFLEGHQGLRNGAPTAEGSGLASCRDTIPSLRIGRLQEALPLPCPGGNERCTVQPVVCCTGSAGVCCTVYRRLCRSSAICIPPAIPQPHCYRCRSSTTLSRLSQIQTSVSKEVAAVTAAHVHTEACHRSSCRPLCMLCVAPTSRLHWPHADCTRPWLLQSATTRAQTSSTTPCENRLPADPAAPAMVVPLLLVDAALAGRHLAKSRSLFLFSRCGGLPSLLQLLRRHLPAQLLLQKRVRLPLCAAPLMPGAAGLDGRVVRVLANPQIMKRTERTARSRLAAMHVHWPSRNPLRAARCCPQVRLPSGPRDPLQHCEAGWAAWLAAPDRLAVRRRRRLVR